VSVHTPLHIIKPPPEQVEIQVPPEHVWPAGQVPVELVQLCVSVEEEPLHEPPEQEYDVTERDWVPVPPHVVALHALQAP
jgi:hypothetical protein